MRRSRSDSATYTLLAAGRVCCRATSFGSPLFGDLKTKKATVNEALREFIQRRKQTEILKLFGSIEFDRNYDHKKGRARQ